MSNVFEIIKQHTVIVDGGSGVLVQPMTDEYSYILTAKHNLLNVYNDNNSGIKELSRIKLMTYGDEKLRAIEIYDHPDLDIAVIKIGFRQGIEVYPHQKSPRAGDAVMLYGYPDINRSLDSKLTSEKIEHYPLRVTEHSKDKISCRNENAAPFDDIKGFSGGGFFYVDEDLGKVFLVGIENAMDSARALHERVKGIHIARFTDFLTEKELAPLKPIHLSGFKYLTELVFPEKYSEHLAEFKRKNFDHVVALLKRDSKAVAELINHTPLEVLTKYKHQLKVNKRDDSELENKTLWSVLLELVVLTSITKKINYDEIDPATLFDNLFKEYRVIYIDSDKCWTTCYEEILTSRIDDLNSNGSVILIMGSSRELEVIISSDDIKEHVDNIGSAYFEDAIDNASPQVISDKNLPIIHWITLHNDCLFSQCDEFSPYNSNRYKDENRSLLNQKYKPYLNPQGGECE